MDRLGAIVALLFLSLNFSLLASAQLKQNYYANVCPSVETIVRGVVKQKIKQTFVTIPATLRLFFHDCFVEGCDASVIVASSGSNIAEKDHPDNLSLAGDGFDTVIKAKAAVDANAGCTNMVSCADILAIATRDVIELSGGPKYKVELGRLDGLSSTSSSVDGKLPQPSFDLNQLNTMFAANGLNQTDMIALSGANLHYNSSSKLRIVSIGTDKMKVRNISVDLVPIGIEDGNVKTFTLSCKFLTMRAYSAACHTLGFSHCSKFSNRIYNFSATSQVDPTLNSTYASQLQSMCPQDVDPRIAIDMDPTTPRKFDNVYYQNLLNHMGLFSSDQVLFTDSRSQSVVNAWASNATAFNLAFVSAMTKLGRVGVKTGANGNIRTDCANFN